MTSLLRKGLRLLTHLPPRHRPTSPAVPGPAAVPAVNVFDRYVAAAPSAQNALDIFQGQWTSRLPDEFAGLQAGHMPLFEDDRVVWALRQFGDLRGKSVLELGPLEGGHSYMLERAGCSVLAIEGNTAAFLKCLVIKEVVGLRRTRYVCGDFVEYLRQSPPRVDLVIASGVLYHMAEPLDLLADVSAVTDRLFIWTHYYDPAAPKPDPSRFRSEETREHKGFRCPVFYIEYEIAATQWNGFCGGPRRFSRWMRREDILGALAHFGFARIETWAEQPDHPHGPAFALIATR